VSASAVWSGGGGCWGGSVSFYVQIRPFLHVSSIFYVTDGNIMYLTDASRFLISCVIQHYAPVVGWGRVEEQMHNVDYHPGP
jgi:hypothetical protein